MASLRRYCTRRAQRRLPALHWENSETRFVTLKSTFGQIHSLQFPRQDLVLLPQRLSPAPPAIRRNKSFGNSLYDRLSAATVPLGRGGTAAMSRGADQEAGGQDRMARGKRSRLMSRVRQRGTTPELVVRRMLRDLGLSYRINVRTLPGSPDIVLKNRKKAIVVHGCFWHRHEGCKATSTPKTRVEFWTGKFARNIARDRKARRELNALGYSVMVIWECNTKRSPERDKVLGRLVRFTKTNRRVRDIPNASETA